MSAMCWLIAVAAVATLGMSAAVLVLPGRLDRLVAAELRLTDADRRWASKL